LQGVLRGLLEDRLLEEPEQLHLVLEPHAQTVSKEGGTVLVAVCHKQWLRDVLAPLQAAGLTVQRLVPELSPSSTPMLHVMGTPDFSQSVLSHAQGVSLLPPNTAHWSNFAPIANQNLAVHAEPSMVERVQQLLSLQPQLQTAAQRWVQSAQSDWDLAQGEWAQGHTQRLQRALQTAWQTLRYAPAWRPVRWGLVALIALQVLGLNALDPDLTQKIQDNMFTFDNLTGVDNKGIQVLMRNVEPDQLMIALKGANDGVKDKFFGNMSERARSMFKDDMDAKGPTRIADVEDAQKKIMRIARKLSDSGDLVLGGGEDFV
jgi:hypothetical protein